MSKSTKRLQKRSERADRRKPRFFAGVDGEGGDVGGRHEYLMLRAGGRLLENADGSPLGLWQCLGFLADLPKDVIYVSFAFDYDVTMMLRGLSPERIGRLLQREARGIYGADGKHTGRYYPVSVGHDAFEIDYMAHKEFRVRRRGGKWTVVSDVFTFFQSSFVVALRKWFEDEPDMAPAIDKIAEGKEMRHDFGAVTEYERDYNRLECIMLERLMEKFRLLCTELDIRPRAWQGPGNLVSAVFKREGLPRKAQQKVSNAVWADSNRAYFGGRFEASTYGWVRKKVWQYDINSAYASYYKRLPCLQHGTWERIDCLPDSQPVGDDSIYLAHVRFRHRRVAQWYTLPVRTDKGTLVFPREGNGWYWCHELELARKHADITVHGGWKYVRRCDCRWFDWVYALYDERDRVGKNSGKGKVLKIVLATIYGKLAQSKGHPVFANPIWSGLVVSYCRATLAEAALQVDGGNDVLMLATDGLFCTSPRSVTIGRGLGEWEETVHEDMFVVQSGLYMMSGEKPKTRGVPQGKVIQLESVFREVWEKWVTGTKDEPAPTVSVPLRVFIGVRLAYARGKTHMAGMWREERKVVRFDWKTKRTDPVIAGTALTTLPVAGSEWLESKEPDWMIGGALDVDRLIDADQPDWGDRVKWDDE
jgi:hypothetical protein